MKTQVGIVGAGPAGLTLSRMLNLCGIESVILESQSRDYIEKRIRAGVLEYGTTEMLNEIGVGDRMMKEGMVHHAVELRFDGVRHLIELSKLTGRQIMVYGQQEIVKDLVAAHLSENRPLLFEVSDVKLSDINTDNPIINFTHDGESKNLNCDIIAGCDGFHGVCRPSIPANHLKIFEHQFPFGWLGILAEAAPSSEMVTYASHEKGFALHSMRSPKLVRNYVQCNVDEDINNWPDDRIWSELQSRMELNTGFKLNEGKILEKSITPMRGFIVEPMQFGNLFLAGDSAHIVPPTGAKGLNLALKDVRFLSDAIDEKYKSGDDSKLNAYSESCLHHAWQAQYFSWWMTSLLHRFHEHDAYQRQLQLSHLRYIFKSVHAATSLAENYVGMY